MSTATLLLLLFSLLFFAELDVPLVDVLLVVVIVVVVFFFIILFSTISCQHESQSHLGALSRSVHAVRRKEEQEECAGFCVPSAALEKPPTIRRKKDDMPDAELEEPAAA